MDQEGCLNKIILLIVSIISLTTLISGVIIIPRKTHIFNITEPSNINRIIAGIVLLICIPLLFKRSETDF